MQQGRYVIRQKAWYRALFAACLLFFSMPTVAGIVWAGWNPAFACLGLIVPAYLFAESPAFAYFLDDTSLEKRFCFIRVWTYPRADLEAMDAMEGEHGVDPAIIVRHKSTDKIVDKLLLFQFPQESIRILQDGL